MGNNNLFKLMTLDATMKTSDIEERFEKIAKMLFESFAIQRVRQCISLKRLSFTSTTRIIAILSLIHGCQNLYVGILMTSEE